MIGLLLPLFFNVASAQSPPVDLNPHLQYSSDAADPKLLKDKIQIRERLITRDGIQYKEIEYNGEFFYVNAKQPESIVNCQQTPMVPGTYALDAGVKLTQYTRLYLQGLRQHCVGDRVVTNPNPRDTNLGISWKGPKPDDNTKKIFVNPVNKTGGFSTNF